MVLSYLKKMLASAPLSSKATASLLDPKSIREPGHRIADLASSSLETYISYDWIYIDKTELIMDLLIRGPHAVWISRPRRFGKSFTLNTITDIAEHNLDVFKGLVIENWLKGQKKHYVMKFDFSNYDSDCLQTIELTIRDLAMYLDALFPSLQITQNCFSEKRSIFISLQYLLEIIAKNPKIVEPIFILIDEYDLPLRVANKEYRDKNLMNIDQLLKAIKGNMEACKFVCVTGILPPFKLGLFSGANFLFNLTDSPLTANLYGFTHSEIEINFREQIEYRAAKEGKSFNEIMNFLRKRYNGYCFCTEIRETVYNPMSVSSYLRTGDIITDQWAISSGVNTFKALDPIVDSSIQNALENTIEYQYDALYENTPTKFGGMSLTNALLHAGYLTIQNPIDQNTLQLNIPNEEVRESIQKDFRLLFKENDKNIVKDAVENVASALNNEDFELLKNSINTYLASFSRFVAQSIKSEKLFANEIERILRPFVTTDISREVSSGDGYCDMVIKINKICYILEFKFNHTAAEAIKQIKAKRYAQDIIFEGKVYGLAINYNPKKNEIDSIKCSLREGPINGVYTMREITKP